MHFFTIPVFAIDNDNSQPNSPDSVVHETFEPRELRKDILGISNLALVLDSIKEAKFAPSNWMFLGLRLGLYLPTLKTIEDNNKHNVDKCLLDCLSAWLRKQDGAEERTWSALAKAMEGIDKSAAEIIRWS